MIDFSALGTDFADLERPVEIRRAIEIPPYFERFYKDGVFDQFIRQSDRSAARREMYITLIEQPNLMIFPKTTATIESRTPLQLDNEYEFMSFPVLSLTYLVLLEPDELGRPKLNSPGIPIPRPDDRHAYIKDNPRSNTQYTDEWFDVRPINPSDRVLKYTDIIIRKTKATDNQLSVIGIDVDQPRFRIVAAAAPDGAAHRPRKVDSSLPARGCVEPLAIAHVLEPALDVLSRLFGDVRDLVVGEALARERRWFGRERLGWIRLLARDIGLRRWALFDIPDRFSGLAVEDVPKTLFRDLHDHVLPLAAALGPRQDRLGRQVVVPKVVVNRLVMPLALTAAGVEGEDRVPEEILAGAVGAEEVERRRAR